MIQQNMMAAVLHGQNDIRYEAYPMPETLPGMVKVRVRAVGICGSDIPRVLGTAAHFYPVVLGHEFSGDVVEVGEGVTHISIGDRVAVAPLIPCGTCESCSQGAYALCKKYSFIGSRAQGGFAEYVVLPEANAVVFTGNCTYAQAALFEPSSVALHGLLQCGFHGGGSVAILGAGTIGVLTAQWAKIYGAASVTLFDIDSDRLAIAAAITGSEGVNLLNEDGEKATMARTGGAGFAYVFGTSGAPQTINLAFQIAAAKARICFIGTPTRDVTFTAEAWERMNRREFTVTGAWMSYSAPFPGQEWTLTSKMIAQGRFSLDTRLIDTVYPLSQCAEAFARFSHPEGVKGKILMVNE